MDNKPKTVCYEVVLSGGHDDISVCFNGPDGLSKQEIQRRAEEEALRKTYVYSVKVSAA